MKERAQNLRRNMTDAGNRMWYYLRNRRLGGYKFVREQVIGNYIADFVCREKKLVIEIDGVSIWRQWNTMHCALKIWNIVDIECYEYGTMKFFKNLEGVMDSILNLLEAVPHSPPHPQPFSLKGEGSSPCHPINLKPILMGQPWMAPAVKLKN